MKTISVEILSDASNYAIIRLPERRYPAMLVQGDSLKTMEDLAQEIRELATSKKSDSELQAAIDELLEQLSSRVKHYEMTLAKEHIPLPYTTLQKAV